MAIYFRIEDDNIMDEMHEALAGSPGYISSEIALVKDEGDTDYTTLCVGDHNDSDVYIDIERAKFTNPLMKEYKFLGGNKMNEMNTMENLGMENQEMEVELLNPITETEIVEESKAQNSLGEILVSAAIGAVIGVGSVIVADQINKRVIAPLGSKLMRKIDERKAMKEAMKEEEMEDKLAEQEVVDMTESTEK